MSAPLNLSGWEVSGQHAALIWQNDDPNYLSIEIEKDGTVCDTIPGYNEMYETGALETGMQHAFRIRGYTESYGWSDWSNYAYVVIALKAPSGLASQVLSGSQVKLTWTNNEWNDTGYDVYQDGVKIDDIAAHSEEYTVSGLTAGVEYKFKVLCHNGTYSSAFSNTVTVTPNQAPAAPGGLTATASGETQINLLWTDNSNNEVDFHIEESSTGPSSGFSELTTVGAGITSYSRTGLTAGQQRWYKIRAHNAVGYSGYSNVASAVTETDIAKPTNVQVFSVKGTVVDLTFDDNSNDEDGHSVEYKIGAGAFAEYDEIEPNRTFLRMDSGISAGNLVTVRVRARKGGNYSDYSDEVAITTPSTPSTPASLAISEQRDTWQKLTWDEVSDAAGYVIYLSTNGADFAEYLRIQRRDVVSVKVFGRTANTQYWYKISAYNGTGESALSLAVDDTTDTEYEEDACEKYLRRNAGQVVLLGEANPKMGVAGFALSSGKTYCYERAIEDRGITVTEVYENGQAMTEEDSQNDVEANAGTWYFDSATRMLYVQMSGGDDPANYQVDAGFWLYFTNWRDPTNTMTFNGNNYLPLLARSRAPEIAQQVHPFFEASLSVSSGTIGLVNAKIGGSHYFDKLWRRYKWENRKIVLKVGGPAFAYSTFKTVYTGMVKKKTITDTTFELGLTDLRESAWRNVPVSELWMTEYGNLDENAEGKKKPFGYGTVTGAIAVCIDTVYKKYMFHNGRVHAVSKVYVNDVEVTIGTACWVDYQRGVIEFAETYTFETTDVVTVDFEGIPETYGTEPLEDAGEVFLDFLTRHLSLSLEDVDTDSVYKVKKDVARNLSVYLDEETSSNEVIKSIEQSTFAFSRQDGEGRVGLNVAGTTAPSWARRVRDYQIGGPKLENDWGSLIKTVKVHYGQNKTTKLWEVVTRSKPSVDFDYNVKDDLKLYTYCRNATDAAAVGDAFLGLFDKDRLTIRVAGLHLIGVLAGDLVYVTKGRYYNEDGALTNEVMLVLKIAHRVSANETTLELQEVA